MVDKQRYQANIAGKNYTIVGNRSSQHMDLVTELVNQQMAHLKQLDPTLSIVDQSILMAINAISDQLIKEARVMELEALLDKTQAASSSTITNRPLPDYEGTPSLSERVPFRRNK